MSARVGESLVFDLRTGSSPTYSACPSRSSPARRRGPVSRLNNDVSGAQQAFTEVLSTVVGNLISVRLVLAAMFVLSWKLTLVALVLCPCFVLPARWLGRRLQRIMREKYDLTADMNTIMVERFNVSGALLVKLFGRPADEDAAFSGKAGRVRDIGVPGHVRPGVLRLSHADRRAGHGPGLWLGRRADHPGSLDVGTLGRPRRLLGRLYGPLTALSNIHVDIMTTLVSFERVFEVLDLEPAVAEKPSAVAIPRGPASIEFRHVDFSYPAAEEVSLASLEAVALPIHRAPGRRCSSTSRSGPSRGSWSPWSARRGPARRPSASWCPVSTMSTRRGEDLGRRRARRHLRVAARGRSAW